MGNKRLFCEENKKIIANQNKLSVKNEIAKDEKKNVQKLDDLKKNNFCNEKLIGCLSDKNEENIKNNNKYIYILINQQKTRLLWKNV